MSLAIIKDEMRNVRTLALANGSAVVANQIVLQNAIVLVACSPPAQAWRSATCTSGK